MEARSSPAYYPADRRSSSSHTPSSVNWGLDLDRRFSSVSHSDACSDISDDGANVISPWEGNTDLCSVCSIKLGKLRRHHCRLCGACVCGGCSPSLVHVEGHRRPQRACTPCVAGAQAVPMVKKRLTRLSGHLRDLGGVGGAPAWAVAEAGSLMEAAALCEEALLPVDQALASAKGLAGCAEEEAATERQARREIEAEAIATKAVLLKVHQRLSGISSSAPKVPANNAKEEFLPGTLREVAVSCAKAVADLEKGRKLGGWSSIRSKSCGASVGSSCHLTSAVEGDNRDFDVAQTMPWEENTPNCGVCGDKLGKRYFNRRHHCRLCGRCVCAACSPSSMILEDGQKDLHRVCTPCASGAQHATTMTRRMDLLAGRIQALSGGESRQATPSNIDQAMKKCEAALAPLEEMFNIESA